MTTSSIGKIIIGTQRFVKRFVFFKNYYDIWTDFSESFNGLQLFV